MKHQALLFVSFFFAMTAFGQSGKKVQFVGGARSLITNSHLKSEGDTVTAPKSSGGYALLDLGVKINPNKNTEVLGMLRIQNAFGGFWGAGVTFDIRQLYVRGVAKDFLKYQIGNIDYKLTPYTFYNHNADLLTRSAGITGMKEDILNYESFYRNNTWRQQGASINFGLQFPKVIQEVDFNAFITRLNPSDFTNIMERLYGGGNMVVKQGKNLDLGFNHVSVFDLAGTAIDSNVYTNNVSSVSYDLHVPLKKFTLGLDGESGISRVEESLVANSAVSDYFVNARAYVNLKKTDWKFHAGFMSNGPDFRSFGAQSKRVDYNQQNNFYRRYTNEQILRPVSLYDVYNDPSLTQRGISVGVMAYHPSINNVLPYGTATFNRQGAYFGTDYSDQKEIVEVKAKVYLLSEIRGQGTNELKQFMMTNATMKTDLSKIWGWKKSIALHTGISYQETNRSGEFDFQKVDLTSFTMNAALEVELIDQLFLLGNLMALNSTGTDQLPVRSTTGDIVNYTNYTVSGTELTTAFGLRFNFSEHNYLGVYYEMNSNNFVPGSPYKYNQASILYTLKF